MKKILSFVVFAFAFVACGSDSADKVAKNCVNALAEGNVKQIAKCYYFKSEDEKQRGIKGLIDNIDSIKTNFTKNGGIKSVETNTLNEVESIAKIQVVITYKNGEVEVEKINLKKVDNNWYLDVNYYLW